MNLKIIKGLDRAKNEINRVDPLDSGSLSQEILDRTRQIFGRDISPLQAVQKILEDVKTFGDKAIFYYSRIIDGVELECVEISSDQIDIAFESVPDNLIAALELAANRVEDFQKLSLRRSWMDFKLGLGEIISPIERVGIYAPGGTAAYPSTVLMTAIPARVAGVKDIVLATPCRVGNLPDPTVLAAAKLAGVTKVLGLGGVQAIAALAYGTESISRVDKICGPGNLFVTLAKKLVFGDVDIDGIYGPTETVVIADKTSNPDFCAADLLAQAEHDPLASPILVTDDIELISKVSKSLDSQLTTLERSVTASRSIEDRSKVYLVDDLDQALELSNFIAPEHLCIMTADPWVMVGKVRHAGGIFLGSYSPEVMGDYVAGPSHVMPTGGTARFSSALGVQHFVKIMPLIALGPEKYMDIAGAASDIAIAEGLTGHSRAVNIRVDSLRSDKGMNNG